MQKIIKVGTELSRLLKKFGIKAKPKCNCNKRMKIMNAKGPDWCKKNIELIVDWLQEEAEDRKLPFLRAAGKVLVKRAISNAQKRAEEQ